MLFFLQNLWLNNLRKCSYFLTYLPRNRITYRTRSLVLLLKTSSGNFSSWLFDKSLQKWIMRKCFNINVEEEDQFEVEKIEDILVSLQSLPEDIINLSLSTLSRSPPLPSCPQQKPENEALMDFVRCSSIRQKLLNIINTKYY